jgi:hypothetical protein
VYNKRVAVPAVLLLQFVLQAVLTAATSEKVVGATLGTQVFILKKVNIPFRILSAFMINILKLRK